jgi:hypothetical protein
MQPLTVSTILLLHTVQEKEGKPDRKPYPLPYVLRKPQVLKLSGLCTENEATKWFHREFGFGIL